MEVIIVLFVWCFTSFSRLAGNGRTSTGAKLPTAQHTGEPDKRLSVVICSLAILFIYVCVFVYTYTATQCMSRPRKFKRRFFVSDLWICYELLYLPSLKQYHYLMLPDISYLFQTGVFLLINKSVTVISRHRGGLFILSGVAVGCGMYNIWLMGS